MHKPMFPSLRSIFLLFLPVFMVSGAKSQAFMEVNTGLPKLKSSNVVCADVDNDGIIDVILSGRDAFNTVRMDLFLGDGNGAFAGVSSNLPALYNVDFCIYDFNADGYPDILLNGKTAMGNAMCRLYLNNTNNTFTEDKAFGTLNHAIVDIGDFNQDGLMDVAYTGQTEDGKRKFFIFLRVNQHFEKTECADIPGMTHGTLITADINNDALPDLVYSGITDHGKSISVFLNTGNLIFEEKTVDLPAVSDGDIQIFDANADGNPDIAITGSTSDESPVTAVFLQDGHLNFTNSQSVFPELHYSALSVGDINNDGYSDLVMNGQRSSGLAHSALYLNNQMGAFNIHSDGLADTKNGAIGLMDVDNDHDLDILFTGLGHTDPTTALLDNTGLPNPNTNPSVPENLMSYTRDNHVFFEWDNAVDNQTTANILLKYHVAIGTESGNYNIIPALPDNSGTTDALWQNKSLFSASNAVFNLPEGGYYWKVLAIDNGFHTSGYSAEKYIQCCNAFTLGNDTSLCLNDTLFFKSPKAGIGYAWFFNGLRVSDSSRVALKADAPGNLVLTVESVSGCITSDTILIDVLYPPGVNLGCDTSRCPNDTIQVFNRLDPAMEMNWFDLTGTPLYGGLACYRFYDDRLDGLVAIARSEAGCTSIDSVAISTIAPASPQLINDTAICSGDSLHLFVDNEFSLPTWKYHENTWVENHFLDYQAISHDTIHFTGLSKEKCAVSKNIMVQVHALPDVSLVEDTSICHGEKLQLTNHYPDQHTTSWRSIAGAPFDISGDTLSYVVLQDDTLVLHITNQFNCTSTDSVLVRDDPLPAFHVSNQIVYCSGDSVAVNMEGTNASDQIHWVNQQGSVFSTDPSLYYTPYDNEKIFATVYTGKGCAITDSVAFTEEKYIHLFPVDDTTLCPGTGVMLALMAGEAVHNLSLSAEHTQVYLDSSNVMSFQTSHADTFVAAYTINDHCSFYDTLAVSLFKSPHIDLPDRVNLCMGDTLWYSPKKGLNADNIKWYNGDGAFLSDSDSLKLTSASDTTLVAIAADTHGCKSADTMVIHRLTLPLVHLPQTFAYCMGDSIRFEVPYDFAAWTFMDHEIIGSKFRDIFTDPTSLVVSVTDSMQCTAISEIHLTAHPTPEITLPGDTVICAGQPFAMNYKAKSGDSVTWFNNNGSSWPNPLQLSADTIQKIFLEVENQQGCSTIDTMRIALFESPNVHLADTIHLCQGQWVNTRDYLVGGIHAENWFYQWYPEVQFQEANARNSRFSTTKDVNITLVIHDGYCQPDTLKSHVFRHENPHLVTSHDTAIGNGSEATLYAYSKNECNFKWYPDNFMFASMSGTPTVFPPVTTTYYVQAMDTFGCSSKDSVTVYIQNKIFIPNLFSPNGDGNNDCLKVYGSGFQYLEIKIFALSGTLVWETNNIEELRRSGWDGTIGGKPAPTSTYIWQISGRYSNGENILYNSNNTGTVQLMR